MLDSLIKDTISQMPAKATEAIGGRILSVFGDQVAASNSSIGTNSGMSIKDNQWTRKSFLSPDVNFSIKADIKGRYWSSAARKFTDTSLGGNIGINETISHVKTHFISEVRFLKQIQLCNRVQTALITL